MWKGDQIISALSIKISPTPFGNVENLIVSVQEKLHLMERVEVHNRNDLVHRRTAIRTSGRTVNTHVLALATYGLFAATPYHHILQLRMIAQTYTASAFWQLLVRELLRLHFFWHGSVQTESDANHWKSVELMFARFRVEGVQSYYTTRGLFDVQKWDPRRVWLTCIWIRTRSGTERLK